MTVAITTTPLLIGDLVEGNLVAGRVYRIKLDPGAGDPIFNSFKLQTRPRLGATTITRNNREDDYTLAIPASMTGPLTLVYTFNDKNKGSIRGDVALRVEQPEPSIGDVIDSSGTVRVSLSRSSTTSTADQCLWQLIRDGHNALSFVSYQEMLNSVCVPAIPLGPPAPAFAQFQVKIAAALGMRGLPFTDTDAYRSLKFLTEAFVASQASTLDGAAISGTSSVCDDYLVGGQIPYLAAVARQLGLNFGSSGIPGYEDWCDALDERLSHPFLVELIWSYWQEQGMLFQAMAALSRRFQNLGTQRGRDPLAALEIGPLRGLSNLLWGYVQDEQHRLSLVRRAYEYDHHYGLRLQGQAVPAMSTADSRSNFLEAFHNLLTLCTRFFRQDDDTTVIADGFPLLNALRDVHIILSTGAHNQFRDLPTTARIEMLMQQYILARPELREYLPRREMVAYPEGWMASVDSMKTLQGWTDVSVMHFNTLAANGEQLVLSIRYGFWTAIGAIAAQAVNWAREWRPEIQAYIHAYRVVTGIDLAAEAVDARQIGERYLQPSTLINRRLTSQQRPQPNSMNGASPKPIGAPARAGVPR